MIESEEKKARLTDIVERWCNHTKVTSYLRDYDISGLISQIIEEFYHIRLCCGHYVRDFDEGIAIAFYDKPDEEVQGLYCRKCAEKYKRDLGAWEIGGEVEEKEEKRNSLYIVEQKGDIEGMDSFATLEGALDFIEKCINPDPEDDRILVWEVCDGGMKVVWHFSGWHWDCDEYGEQGKLLGHGRSLYHEVMDEY